MDLLGVDDMLSSGELAMEWFLLFCDWGAFWLLSCCYCGWTCWPGCPSFLEMLDLIESFSIFRYSLYR